MKTKSDISLEEEKKALQENANYWNACNPSFKEDLQHWEEKLEKAKDEGYKSEKCSCGCIFLAFHHYVRCEERDCPFSDGVSLLDRMTEAD